MPIYRQMTDHTLDPVKGWPSQHAVDFAAPLAASVLSAITGGIVFAGRCVHLNDSGEFEMGVTGEQMPLFLFNNSDDPDVSNEGGNPATSAHAWVPTAPTGKLMALVAAGAYELASTEFDATQTYLPNDFLYAATGTTLATCGVLTNQGVGGNSYPDETAVGVVSRGRTPTSATNAHRVAEVYFWPGYYPSHTHA